MAAWVTKVGAFFLESCVPKVGACFLESCVLRTDDGVLGLVMVMLPEQTLSGEQKAGDFIWLGFFATLLLACCIFFR